MDKYAVGIDVAWDRSHTTVAIAGHVKELTSVAIAAYHPGADRPSGSPSIWEPVGTRSW